MGKHKLFCLLIVVSVLLAIVQSAFAHSGKVHNSIMEEAFFGQNKTSGLSNRAKEVVEIIENAAYLCIDQHNAPNNNMDKSDDAQKLAKLKDRHRIKWLLYRLPSSIAEINVAGNDHRAYTHKGWEHDYTKGGIDKAHWEKRKRILLSTVCFEFGFSEGSFGSFDPGTDSQCDSFCQLIYYLHVLGDHEEDITYHEKAIADKGVFSCYQESGDMMGVAQIVSELITIGNSLFVRSKTEWENGMKIDLLKVQSEFDRIGYACDSEQEFNQYTNDFKVLYGILLNEQYLPKLLSKELFFEKTFLTQ